MFGLVHREDQEGVACGRRERDGEGHDSDVPRTAAAARAYGCRVTFPGVFTLFPGVQAGRVGVDQVRPGPHPVGTRADGSVASGAPVSQAETGRRAAPAGFTWLWGSGAPCGTGTFQGVENMVWAVNGADTPRTDRLASTA